MKKIIIVFLFYGVLYAKSNTEKIGDFLTFAIPAVAYGSTFYMDDAEGREQFYWAYGTAMTTTVVLKYSIKEKRPDNNDRDSFPSGHTASAMTGATFIHKRYGFKYAIPAYIGAIYTGYSRIQVNRHHPHDVVVGAIIGAAASWYFVDPMKKLNIVPVIDSGYQGISIKYRF
jgi:membrane-associated phospholipid phosphatase